MKYFLSFFLLAIIIVSTHVSCRRDKSLITDNSAKLTFSTDTVLFDTVFTTVGTATRRFKVYNPHNKSIKISNIFISDGNLTNFRMNVDGVSGNSLKDIVIRPQDSIFIFIEATIDPNNGNTPLIVSDAVVFETNGNIQEVKLVAWGQDAYFYNFALFCDYTLTNEKPHVFYGYSFIDSACTLTIQEGVQLHFHPSSGLIALTESTLEVLGSEGNPVVFQGDRLESSFDELPGQWDRIWLTATSKDHLIQNAIIKNGNIGIHVDTVGSNNPTLTLHNVVIKNMSGLALLGQGAHIEASNCVFANCGQYVAALIIGGNYSFTHCTFANYWSFASRDNPLLLVRNYFEDNAENIHTRDLENLYFGNCIIHGSEDEEITLDENSGASFNYLFDHCILKTEMDLDDEKFKSTTKNPEDILVEGKTRNPIFEDPSENNYQLFESSVAIDKGDVSITNTLTSDIEGNIRDANPDLGAYEFD